MQYALALAALAGAALAAPQGVTAVITPSAPAPSGCAPSFSGKFQIQTVNVTTASKKLRIRQDLPMNQPGGPLIITLADGVLTDAQGRTGYIASNEQLQFDGPPQDGAIYTAGFSACSNSTLALGGTTIFYQCPTSNYFNLYDSSVAPQCSPVYIQLLPYSGPTGATELTDGQPGVTSAVSQISDGQPQATGAVTTPISVISDGQPQATGAVSEISDGQPQVSGAASTPAPAPVTQISDGQIQATTPAPAPITQISDGQIQAPTTPVAPISQISDGQIQAPNATISTGTPLPYTGAASIPTFAAEMILAAGAVAYAMI